MTLDTRVKYGSRVLTVCFSCANRIHERCDGHLTSSPNERCQCTDLTHFHVNTGGKAHDLGHCKQCRRPLTQRVNPRFQCAVRHKES